MSIHEMKSLQHTLLIAYNQAKQAGGHPSSRDLLGVAEDIRGAYQTLTGIIKDKELEVVK